MTGAWWPERPEPRDLTIVRLRFWWWRILVTDDRHLFARRLFGEHHGWTLAASTPAALATELCAAERLLADGGRPVPPAS